MSVLDDIHHGKEPEQEDVAFCVDHRLRRHLSEAQFELEKAKIQADRPGMRDDQLEAARNHIDECQDMVDELLEQARGRMIRFTFGAMDPQDFDALKGEHRPTSTQITKAKKDKRPQPEWNVDTFPPALVAAACVRVEGPSGTADGLAVEDVQQMWSSRSWNQAERNEMFNAALAAQVQRTRVDLPKAE